MINLDNYELPTLFAVSLIAILGASEIGRLVGARLVGRGSGDVSTLEGAILGLLALMIGFTFAMALSRFEARRDAVVNEANAIGTTALRARLLPAPNRSEALRLLKEYVQIRLEVTRSTLNAPALKTAISRSNQIQEALWQTTIAVAAKDAGLVPTGVFIQSLNEMIDNQATRLAAVQNRVPNIVFLGLYGVAIVAFAFVGYANGLQKRRLRLPAYLMGAIVASVILLVQDLDRPTVGFISVSQQPMLDLAASIASYSE
jgi:Protein of unknown function (DUF4239)